MWRTSDGVVHYNRIAEPGNYIDPLLRRRLDALSDEQKVSHYYALDQSVAEAIEVIAHSGDVDGLTEAPFEGEWLPESYRLMDGDSASLEELVLNQAGQTPSRWRVELISLAPTYLLDTGPKWRRWKQIMRTLEISMP